MTRSLLTALALVAGLVAATPGTASAQAQTCTTTGCTIDVAYSSTVPAAGTSMTLSQTAVVLTTPAVGLTGTVTNMAVWTYTIAAPSTWTLQVQSPAATMTPGGGSTYNKPVSNISWSIAAAAPATALSTTLTTVDSGTGNKAATSFNVAQAYANDQPGTYAGAMRFRFTSP